MRLQTSNANTRVTVERIWPKRRHVSILIPCGIYPFSLHVINSWEPVESFAGSEDIVDRFWERANVGGRDYRNISLFNAGEQFLLTGPPRMLSQLVNNTSTYRMLIRTQGKTKITETRRCPTQTSFTFARDLTKVHRK
jgi:hypothetical protein